MRSLHQMVWHYHIRSDLLHTRRVLLQRHLRSPAPRLVLPPIDHLRHLSEQSLHEHLRNHQIYKQKVEVGITPEVEEGGIKVGDPSE